MGGSAQRAPESTGQLGPFTSLGQDPANSQRLGGGMMTSTTPTGAGTAQPLVGAQPDQFKSIIQQLMGGGGPGA